MFIVIEEHSSLVDTRVSCSEKDLYINLVVYIEINY